VCHGIVNGHGGDIRIESEVGRGTAVIVRLPAPASGVQRAA
jgi:signal transduction histidine kinase